MEGATYHSLPNAPGKVRPQGEIPDEKVCVQE